MDRRISSAAMMILVIMAFACRQTHQYQGVGLTVLNVQRSEDLRSDGPIVSVKPEEDKEFVVVRLEIAWPPGRQEIALDHTILKLTDDQGKSYGPAIWSMDPLSSAGKKKTIEEIKFMVPKGTRLKNFYVGDICFNI